MVFEMILSGLCAFVLSPCGNPDMTKKVSAVFPGGPLTYTSHSYPAHQPTIIVDPTDIDPDMAKTTMMPEMILEEPGGKQYAYFKLKGEITLTIDGQTPTVSLAKSFDNVTSLKKVIDKKEEVGTLKKELLDKVANEYSMAHLTLPFDKNGAAIGVSKSKGYKFHGGTLKAAERARVEWKGVTTIVFKDGEGKTLTLRDSPDYPDSQVRVVLSSFSNHLEQGTKDLAHFPMYYFLSTYDLAKLTDKEWMKPTPSSVTEETGSAAKPIACAICVGCGG